MRFGLMVVLLCALAASVGCAGDEHGGGKHRVDFVGFVYDGANGAKLMNYTVEAWVLDRQIEGKVDAETGRYVIKGINAFSDFTVVISAEGYRAFVSHNAMVGLPPDLASEAGEGALDVDIRQTLFVDGFLFPTELAAPQVTIEISLSDDTEAVAEGTIRLRATGASFLADGGSATTPAGVDSQIWMNDNDLQAEVITEQFTDGEFVLEEGRLVYGVTYSVDVFGVTGYQPRSTSLDAGFDSFAALSLTPITPAPSE